MFPTQEVHMWPKATWQTKCWRCESKASKRWHGLESKNVNTFEFRVFNCLYGSNYGWGVFSIVHVVCVVWFFLCCKFLLFLKTLGCLRDEELVIENWWNNMWMRMCDGRTKWRCKELVKNMQVKQGIFKLNTYKNLYWCVFNCRSYFSWFRINLQL